MFSSYSNLVFIFVSTIFVLTDAARILAVFPVPSISHQVVFRPLTQELAKRGHELVILTTDPAFTKEQTPMNITEIDLHDKSYEVRSDSFIKNVDLSATTALKVIEIAMRTTIDIFENQINTKEVQDLLKSGQHFDLIFTEAMVRVALVFSHIFKAPLIQVSSMGAAYPNYQVMGAPIHPILYPGASQHKIYNLSVWEKIYALHEDYNIKSLIWFLEETENSMLKRNFGPNTPTVSELANNVDMMFLNVNPIFEGNRPVPPSVIHMGGLHQSLKPQKDLPTDLKTYLDASTYGVIYMSFGTNVSPSKMPPERIEIFTKVFSRLPYAVLWKWDKDEMTGQPKNVRLSKWLPQSDLLRHPKVKLFITQAGLQSTDEAITAGVPLIAFPMLGDQWYNAEKYVYHNIGMKFELEDITEEVLESSIKSVIEDGRYRRNVIRLGQLMRDQPQKPLERAVWWTEYVIRHRGAKHLRSPAANITWTEYLLLDVLTVVIAVLVVCLGVLVGLCKVLLKMFLRNGKVKIN